MEDKNKSVLIIYHSKDLDGLMSGAIAYSHYQSFSDLSKIKTIGWDYDDPIPDTSQYTKVVILDISFPMDVMAKISEQAKLIWIDHHITAFEDYEDYVELNGSFDVIIPIYAQHGDSNYFAACEKTWLYFNKMNMLYNMHNTSLRDEKDYESAIPQIIRYLGAYDTWRYKKYKDVYSEADQDEIIKLQHGSLIKFQSIDDICNHIDHVEAFVYNMPDTYFYNQLLESGMVCQKAFEFLNKRACNSAFEIKINRKQAICLNNNGSGSQSFKSIYNPDKHDIMMSFYYKGKGMWSVSLYSDNGTDVSEIAIRQGGGGHKGASGFTTHDIRKYLKDWE